MTRNHNLTNEQKITILTSRLTFSKQNEERLAKLMKEELDWYNIFKIAIANKVLPLVWHNLSVRKYQTQIPGRLSRIIYFYYLGTRERNRVYLEELKRVVTAMNSNGISCIPLKGAFLIPHVYKDYGIRTVNDMDCMIKRSDVKILRAVMNRLGYVQGEYDSKTKSIKPPSREKGLLWKMYMYNLFPFERTSGSEYVQSFGFDFCFDLDFDLKADPVSTMVSRAMKSNKQPFYCLKTSDFLMHLCCHLFKEATNAMWVELSSDLNLIKFCDAREFILQLMDSKSLKEAVQFAKEYGLEKPLYFTLFYLNEIYGDGYECSLIDTLEIKDTSFLYAFGKKDFEKEITWKKSFWERLFSESNKDELPGKPKYLMVD